MESNDNTSKDKNKDNEYIKSNPSIGNIKSNYILSKIYDNIPKIQKLEIVKYNKKLQKRLNLDIKYYKEYSEIFSSIEIEIIPTKDKYGKFININENDKLYYHIYFNDNGEEIKNKHEIKIEDKVTKIKIIIDYQVKSFKDLFYGCICVETINFKKFYRNNINNMSYIFSYCSSLKELNLINFNTDNVNDMNNMFSHCSLLKELNLINFNTDNVVNMCFMFDSCSSLKELNLTNFNTNKVINMSYMFYGCSSLKDLDISNFNTNNVTNMKAMFYGCSDDLIKKIKYKEKNIRNEAFYVNYKEDNNSDSDDDDIFF